MEEGSECAVAGGNLQSAKQLHAWVKEKLDLQVPTRPVCPGHDAPFDYLRRSYFEEGGDLIVWAPRGGGKTRLGAVATLLDLLHKSPCSVRILGGSLQQSLRMWEHLCPDIERLASNEIDGRITAQRIRLLNGSTAAVLTQSQRAVRGLRVQKLRCDEVELFDPEVWEAAQLVTRSRRAKADASTDPNTLEVRGTIEALSTFHRPFGLMSRIIDEARRAGVTLLRWCLLEVLERCPPERGCESCPLQEDCRGVARSRCEGFFAIDDAIAMKRRVSLETWQAEMLCRRPSLRSAVFPNFDPANHVSESVEASGELWLAIDFGFSSPFVCLWIARGPEGRTYVFDEYLQVQRMLHEHLTQIQQRPWPRAAAVACDPAGSARHDQTAVSNVQLLRKAGYRVRHRPSRIIDGLEMIRAALRPASGPSRLCIHPRCQHLIRAMQAYRYADTGSELPLKDGTHDHPIDALRYFFVNQHAMGKVVQRAY